MDWIFDHLWVLIAIATVIGRVLMKRGEGNTAEGEQPAQPKAYEFEDPELAERTRKIREEIQRKIAERRGQHTLPPVLPAAQARPAPLERSPEATPPPVPQTNLLLEVLKSKLEPIAPAQERKAVVNIAEEAAHQRALMEKLKEAELMKASAQRRVAFESSTADKEPAALLQARTVVLDDLRSPQALRRAFVLREVLGPPVSLR